MYRTFGDKLFEELLYFLRHQPFGSDVSRFQLKDYLIGDLGLECADHEIEEAIKTIEKRYCVTFPEGSLRSDVKVLSAEELAQMISSIGRSERSHFTKLDELMFNVRETT